MEGSNNWIHTSPNSSSAHTKPLNNPSEVKNSRTNLKNSRVQKQITTDKSQTAQQLSHKPQGALTKAVAKATILPLP